MKSKFVFSHKTYKAIVAKRIVGHFTVSLPKLQRIEVLIKAPYIVLNYYGTLTIFNGNNCFSQPLLFSSEKDGIMFNSALILGLI